MRHGRIRRAESNSDGILGFVFGSPAVSPDWREQDGGRWAENRRRECRSLWAWSAVSLGMKLKKYLFSAIAAALFLIFIAIYNISQDGYAEILAAWGLVPHFPFGDANAILSAIECHRQGVDVFEANPCDMYARPLVYSSLWLWAGVFPVTTGWTNAVGIGLGILFAFSLSFLPEIAGFRRQLAFAAAVVSPMTAYAIERGNNDLAVFFLLSLAMALIQRAPIARSLGYLSLILAGLLKFYPLMALSVACLREKPRAVLLISLVGAAATASLVLGYWQAWPQIQKHLPHGELYTDLFSARNLPLGLTQLVADPLSAKYPWLAPFTGLLPYILFAMMLGQWAVQTYRVSQDRDLNDALRETALLPAAFLLCGSVLIVGCFFAGQNIYYRGILFLFVLSGLFSLSDSSTSTALRSAIVKISAFIIFLMWSECLRQNILLLPDLLPISPAASNNINAFFWLLRELVWWRVVAFLSGVIAGELARSEMWRWARGLAGNGFGGRR